MFYYLKIFGFMIYYYDKKNTMKKILSEEIMINNKEGIDGRFALEENKENDNYLTNKIMINFKKKETLEFLENNKISMVTKLDFIEESNKNKNHSKYMSNFFAGGLMDEFLF